jgi:hypothetical protein
VRDALVLDSILLEPVSLERKVGAALARPVVKTKAVQPPRNLPKLLACVRIHDREVRTYELIKRFPRRGLSCKYHTIIFWDEGCTEIKNP